MASHSKDSDQRAKNMGEETGKLKLSDCICPICMYILIDPVTMPCRHELCMPCFKQNVQEASLTCPMCRTRISIWARKAGRNNRLVNETRWREIQEAFPQRVKNRLDGVEDDYSSDEEMGAPVLKQLAQPGEIRQEYEEQLQKLRAERRVREREEAAASERLIRELQEEEIRVAEERRQELEQLAAQDEAVAKELAEQLNELNSTVQSPTSNPTDLSKSAQKSLPRTLLDKFVKRGTRNASNSNSPMGAGKTNYGSQTGEDKYPYTCISPWEKDEDKKSDTSKAGDIFSSASHRSTSSNGTVDYVYIDSRPCSTENDLNKNGSGEHGSNVPLVGMTEEIHVHGTPIDVVGLDDVIVLEPEMVPTELSQEVGDICSKDTEDVSKSDGSRSGSEGSSDSITQELVHFKPIQACPKTPPRRLPGGRVVDPPLIRSTPTNLTRSGIVSPSQPQCFSPENPAGSPIMQKRLMALAAERQEQVRILSKGTSTDTEEDSVAMDHCYSSPTKRPSFDSLSQQSSVPSVPEVPCVKVGFGELVSSKTVNPQMAAGSSGGKITIQQLLQRKKNVTATESSACATSRKLAFETVESLAELPVIVTDKVVTDDTLQLLPLESNLEEDEHHIVPETLKCFNNSLVETTRTGERVKTSRGSPGHPGHEKWLNNENNELDGKTNDTMFGSGDSLRMAHPGQPPGLSPLNLSAKKYNNGDSNKKQSKGSIRQWLVNPTDGASPSRPSAEGTPPKWVSLLNPSNSVSGNIKSGMKNMHLSRMPPLPSLQPSVITTLLTPNTLSERQREVTMKTYFDRTPMIIEKLKEKCGTPPSKMTSTKMEVKEVNEHSVCTPTSSKEYKKMSHWVYEKSCSSSDGIPSSVSSRDSTSVEKRVQSPGQETYSAEGTNISEKMDDHQSPNHQRGSANPGYEPSGETYHFSTGKAEPWMSVSSENSNLPVNNSGQVSSSATEKDLHVNSDMDTKPSGIRELIHEAITNNILSGSEMKSTSEPLTISRKSRGPKSPRKPALVSVNETDSPSKKKGRKRKVTADKFSHETCTDEKVEDNGHCNNGETFAGSPAKRSKIHNHNKSVGKTSSTEAEVSSEYLLPSTESKGKVSNSKQDTLNNSPVINDNSNAGLDMKQSKDSKKSVAKNKKRCSDSNSVTPEKETKASKKLPAKNSNTGSGTDSVTPVKHTKPSKKSPTKNRDNISGTDSVTPVRQTKASKKSPTKSRDNISGTDSVTPVRQTKASKKSPTKSKNLSSDSDSGSPVKQTKRNKKIEEIEKPKPTEDENLAEAKPRMKISIKTRGKKKKGTKLKSEVGNESSDIPELVSPTKERWTDASGHEHKQKQTEEFSSVQEVDDEVSFNIKQTPERPVDISSQKDSPQKLSASVANQSDIESSPAKRKRGRPPSKKRQAKRIPNKSLKEEDEVSMTPEKGRKRKCRSESPDKIDLQLHVQDACSVKESSPKIMPRHKAKAKNQQKGSVDFEKVESSAKENIKGEFCADTRRRPKKRRGSRKMSTRRNDDGIMEHNAITEPLMNEVLSENCKAEGKYKIDARRQRIAGSISRCSDDTFDHVVIKAEKMSDSEFEVTPKKKPKLKKKRGKKGYNKLDGFNSDTSPEKDKGSVQGGKERKGQTEECSDLDASRSPTNSSSENSKSPAKKKLHQLKRQGRRGRSARDKCVSMEIVDENSRDVLDAKSDGDDSSVQESPKGNIGRRHLRKVGGKPQPKDWQATLPSKELGEFIESETLSTPKKVCRGKQRYRVEYSPDSMGKRKKHVLTDIIPEKPIEKRKTRGNKGGPIQNQTMLQFVTVTKGHRKSDDLNGLSHVRQLPFSRGQSSSPSRSSTSSMARSDRTKDMCRVGLEVYPKSRSGSTSTLQSTAGSDCKQDLVKPDETRKVRSDFKTDRQYHAYLEEQDRLMALQLQADFDMEAKLNLTAIRRKGSEGEYDFRGKKMDFSLYFSDNDIRMARPSGQRKVKK